MCNAAQHVQRRWQEIVRTLYEESAPLVQLGNAQNLINEEILELCFLTAFSSNCTEHPVLNLLSPRVTINYIIDRFVGKNSCLWLEDPDDYLHCTYPLSSITIFFKKANFFGLINQVPVNSINETSSWPNWPITLSNDQIGLYRYHWNISEKSQAEPGRSCKLRHLLLYYRLSMKMIFTHHLMTQRSYFSGSHPQN